MDHGDSKLGVWRTFCVGGVAVVCVLAAALLVSGCARRESTPKQASASPAATEVTCPNCNAKLRPGALIRPVPGSPVAACPKCAARVLPPKSALAAK